MTRNARACIMLHAEDPETSMGCDWLDGFNNTIIMLRIDGHTIFLSRESLGTLCKVATEFAASIAPVEVADEQVEART